MEMFMNASIVIALIGIVCIQSDIWLDTYKLFIDSTCQSITHSSLLSQDYTLIKPSTCAI